MHWVTRRYVAAEMLPHHDPREQGIARHSRRTQLRAHIGRLLLLMRSSASISGDWISISKEADYDRRMPR